MKVIQKRLSRLENKLIPRATTEWPLVALLRERERRNAEAEGRTYEEEPWEDLRGLAYPGPAERAARAPMNRMLVRRLDRLEERVLPPLDVPTKCWQIVYVSHEGTEKNGPLLKWGPGYKDPDASFDQTRIILDRLVHNAHWIETRGDSMRKNRGKSST
jgi:hypothetical protein